MWRNIFITENRVLKITDRAISAGISVVDYSGDSLNGVYEQTETIIDYYSHNGDADACARSGPGDIPEGDHGLCQKDSMSDSHAALWSIPGDSLLQYPNREIRSFWYGESLLKDQYLDSTSKMAKTRDVTQSVKVKQFNIIARY